MKIKIIILLFALLASSFSSPLICLASAIFSAPKLISYCNCSTTSECIKITFYIADVTNCHTCGSPSVTTYLSGFNSNNNFSSSAHYTTTADGTTPCIYLTAIPCKMWTVSYTVVLSCGGVPYKQRAGSFVEQAQNCRSQNAHTHNIYVNFCI